MGSGSPRSDPYAAYCFDEAVATFGWYVDSEIEKAKNGAKNSREAEARVQQRIRMIFQEESEDDSPPPAGTFKDPAERFSK